jgi:hypothetical protein
VSSGAVFGFEALMLHFAQLAGLISSIAGLVMLCDEARKVRGFRRVVLWLAIVSGIAVIVCR